MIVRCKTSEKEVIKTMLSESGGVGVDEHGDLFRILHEQKREPAAGLHTALAAVPPRWRGRPADCSEELLMGCFTPRFFKSNEALFM